jgi:GAF domain-containing protein
MDDRHNGGLAVPESGASTRAVRAWQQQLVRGVLRALVILGPLVAAVSSYYAYTLGQWWAILIYWSAYTILLVIAFWKRVPYSVQAGTIMALLYGLALLDFLTDGRGGSARVFLLVLPVMAGLLFGTRESIAALVVAILTVGGYAWAYSTGALVITQEVDSADLAGWLSNTFVLLLLGSLVVVSHNYLVPRLGAALNQSQGLARALEEERAKLESQVAERTKVLEQRTRYLEATGDIAREASSVLDLEALLPRVVSLISERFALYRMGIFLLEPGGEWAVLRAASGVGGLQLLGGGFRVRVEGTGIVAHVIRSGRSYLAPDVSQDRLYLDLEEVADTRSELTLPLRARGEILGALSVQSPEPDAFGEEDVAVMQTLADQVALAISNARLFEQAQEGLEAERRAYGELSREAWQQLVRAQPDLAVLRDQGGISPVSTWLDGAADAEVEQALRTGRPATSPAGATNLAVPIVVRGHVIGAIDAHKPAEGGEWTPEQIALLKTLSEQVGDALEGARLYEEARRRAARDRLTYEIADRMRRAVDMDALMKIAIQETATALGASDAFVQVAAPSDLSNDDGGTPEP